VLSRQTLLKRVWDYGFAGDSRLVDAAVARLRAKIEPDPGNPTLLRTARASATAWSSRETPTTS
jgi:DNA-binding response OmpR family regulator